MSVRERIERARLRFNALDLDLQAYVVGSALWGLGALLMLAAELLDRAA